MIVFGLDGEKFSTVWSGPSICNKDYRGSLLVMTDDVTKIVVIDVFDPLIVQLLHNKVGKG